MGPERIWPAKFMSQRGIPSRRRWEDGPGIGAGGWGAAAGVYRRLRKQPKEGTRQGLLRAGGTQLGSKPGMAPESKITNHKPPWLLEVAGRLEVLGGLRLGAMGSS